MKPPSRKRAKPDRYLSRRNDQEKRRKNRLICSAWKRSEQQNLLMGLHKQSNTNGGTSDINFAALKEKIPKRSIQEVESIVEALKNHTVKVVVQKLNRQKREEKTARVPIEVWTKLAEDITGSLDDPITAAFSQMLVICSTEPRSLKNSDPPRDDRSEMQIPADLRTIPFRPMPMPMPTAAPNPSPVLLLKSPQTQTRGRAGQSPSPSPSNPPGVKSPKLAAISAPLPGASPVVSTACGSTNQGALATVPRSGRASRTGLAQPASKAAAVTSAEPPSSAPSSGSGPLLSNTSTQPARQLAASSPSSASPRAAAKHSLSPSPASVSTSSPATSTSTCSTTPCTVTTTPSSSSSSSCSPSVSSSTPTSIPTSTSSSSTSQHTTFGRRSKHAQENWPRTLGLRSIVDFEKIYSYLGSVHKPSQEHTLTPMESAVLLDLLLSLPEELPLLDCVGLEQHMIQVHAFLTSPAGSSVEGPKMADHGQVGETQDGVGEEPGAVVADAVDPPPQNGLSKNFLQTQPSQVGGGGNSMQPTNQGEVVVATEPPGKLLTGTPCPVVMDGAGLQRAVTGGDGQAESQSALPVNTSGQSGSRNCQGPEYWEKADLCPLNPFMVPVQLLARRLAQ